jgi:hypothetical protein
MKTISVSVSEDDYELFRRQARLKGRKIAELIREAMALYRDERLVPREPLREIPLLAGHRLTGPIPSRAEVWDEIFTR